MKPFPMSVMNKPLVYFPCLFYLFPSFSVSFYCVHLESATQPTAHSHAFISKAKRQTSIGIIFRMTRLCSAGWLIFVKMCLLMEPLSASTGNWPKSAKMPLEPLGRKWLIWGTQWTAATLTRVRRTETIPWLWHSWRLTTTTDVGSQKKL